MIRNLSKKDIGKTVVYAKGAEWEETGKIKSFNNEITTAFVVFKCNNDWDNFKDYTGQSTKYSDLNLVVDPNNCEHEYRHTHYKWKSPNHQICIECGHEIE